MSLFKLETEQQRKPVSGAIKAVGVGHCLPIHSKEILSQVIGKLEPEQNTHFVSRGEWSMHDLLEFVLGQTGPADIYLTTWALTEEPVRKLFFMKEAGLIKNLYCLVDYRLQVRKPEPLQLLKNMTDHIEFTQCHAKVTVIENEDWQVSVMGSANYTKNPRIEAGILSTLSQVAAFHKEWIKSLTHGTHTTTTTRD